MAWGWVYLKEAWETSSVSLTSGHLFGVRASEQLLEVSRVWIGLWLTLGHLDLWFILFFYLESQLGSGVCPCVWYIVELIYWKKAACGDRQLLVGHNAWTLRGELLFLGQRSRLGLMFELGLGWGLGLAINYFRLKPKAEPLKGVEDKMTGIRGWSKSYGDESIYQHKSFDVKDYSTAIVSDLVNHLRKH